MDNETDRHGQLHRETDTHRDRQVEKVGEVGKVGSCFFFLCLFAVAVCFVLLFRFVVVVFWGEWRRTRGK